MRERRRHRAQGFTLVEMMIVVMVMALIATAVGIGVMRVWEDTRVKQTRTDANRMMSAADMYLLEEGGDACPTVDELPLDRRQRTTDAWERPFHVECDERGVFVRSAGPDGVWENEDDIRSGAENDDSDR